MTKLTEAQRRALMLMASRPDGRLDMHRGRCEAAPSTINRLEWLGLASWCCPEMYEPQMAEITPAGRAALSAQERDDVR